MAGSSQISDVTKKEIYTGAAQAVAQSLVRSALAGGPAVEITTLDTATAGDPPIDRLGLKEKMLRAGMILQDGKTASLGRPAGVWV